MSIKNEIERLRGALPEGVRLLAVSKFHPVEALQQAYDAGQRAFGESRPQELKVKYLGSVNPRLHTDEILIALSTCAATDENAQKALEQLPKLRGCQVHTTVLLSSVDKKIFKKLGLELTSDPVKRDKKTIKF